MKSFESLKRLKNVRVRPMLLRIRIKILPNIKRNHQEYHNRIRLL